MCLKSVIFSFILLGVATKCLVQGLQCYVCKDCNEYEDFKELHICGEIPIVATAKPIILPGPLDSSVTKEPEIKPTLKPLVEPTLKPILPDNPDNYLDSDESHNEVRTTTKSSTNATATQSKTTTKPTNTAAQSKTTTKPAMTNTNSKTTTKPTAATVTARPTALIETALKETNNKTTTANTTTSSMAAVATATKPKPVTLPDYDDYLEYEDPMERRSARSLLKINEPVCYMIKYQVNNTVFTNRGCTSFINANKYLTCQTLYNGAPMDACRICSSNGCNKFLSGESEEDDISAAGILEKLSIVVSLIFVLINRWVF